MDNKQYRCKHKSLCDCKKLTHERKFEREHHTISTVLLPLAIIGISIFIIFLSSYYHYVNYDVLELIWHWEYYILPMRV